MSLTRRSTAERGVRYIRKIVVSLILSAVAATIGTFAWPPERLQIPWMQNLSAPVHTGEAFGYDVLLGFQGRREDRLDPRIVVLGFDRDDEVTLGESWPISRKTHAKVIRNLKAAGAKVIAYDVLFSTPSSIEADKDLDAALQEAGNVVLTSRIDRGSSSIQRKSIEHPYYDDRGSIDLEGHSRSGLAEVPTSDVDGVVRSIQLAITLQGEPYPSFPLAVFQSLNGLPAEDLDISPSSVQVGNYSFPVSMNIPDPYDGTSIPLAAVNYPAGAAAFPMPATFSQVVAGKESPNVFKDKIVFVGLTGSQLTKEIGEHYQTAYSRTQSEWVSGSVQTTEVPGVVIQALHFNALINRTFIREAPAATIWIVTFSATFIAIALVRRFSNILGLGLVLVSGASIFGIAWLALRYGQMHMAWLIPMIGTCACAAGVGWLESGTIKRKWAGYVSPAVLEQILKGDEDLGAKRYEASVMFGDIRGFTSFSEKHSPEAVVDVLNLHLEKLTKIISDEHGTIDKFLGDGILACFGAPIAFDGSAVAAVGAAWKMREAAMEPVMDASGASHVLATGFGITTGPFLAGDIGSKQLKNWTVIGDVVNLASRLQGVTGEPDVIIDSETYRLVHEHATVQPLGAVTLKGKAQPVECFKVVRWSDKPIKQGTSDGSNSNVVARG